MRGLCHCVPLRGPHIQKNSSPVHFEPSSPHWSPVSFGPPCPTERATGSVSSLPRRRNTSAVLSSIHSSTPISSRIRSARNGGTLPRPPVPVPRRRVCRLLRPRPLWLPRWSPALLGRGRPGGLLHSPRSPHKGEGQERRGEALLRLLQDPREPLCRRRAPYLLEPCRHRPRPRRPRGGAPTH